MYLFVCLLERIWIYGCDINNACVRYSARVSVCVLNWSGDSNVVNGIKKKEAGKEKKKEIWNENSGSQRYMGLASWKSKSKRLTPLTAEYTTHMSEEFKFERFHGLMYLHEWPRFAGRWMILSSLLEWFPTKVTERSLSCCLTHN